MSNSFHYFQRVNEVKIHSLNEFEVLDFFLRFVKRLEMMMKATDSVKIWLKRVIFQPFVDKL